MGISGLGSAHAWNFVRRPFFGSARRLNLALFLSVDHVATYVMGRRRFGDSGGASFVEFREAVFESSVLFYLMCINARHAADLDSDRRSSTDGDWVVSLEKASELTYFYGECLGTLVRLRLGLN